MRRPAMALKDLVTRNRGRELSERRGDDINPLLTLHREMNRVFNDVFRGFGAPAPIGSILENLDTSFGWPNLEVSETENQMKVVAELPGLDEKDINVETANGVLSIR